MEHNSQSGTEVGAQIVLALDAEGGDRAPGEVVSGALDAASPELKILLVGRPQVVEPLIAGISAPHVELVPCASVIDSYQEPAAAVRSQPDSSIAVGARLVREGRALGFVSAGSTGAVLAASLLIVKRVEGIRRPAILTTLPGRNGPVLFLDAGANADCRPEHLLEFGVLGAAYARAVLGKERPTVGLLNIGEERGKGNELAIGAHRILRDSALDFVGNVEGRDLLSGAADVVVTDGFTGNVALKLLEGCGEAIFSRMKEAAEQDLRGKIGGMLLRPRLRGLRSALDPEAYGGTYLLGVRGLVVICHGNSSRLAIANALRFGAEALRKGVLKAVETEVGHILAQMDASASS